MVAVTAAWLIGSDACRSGANALALVDVQLPADLSMVATVKLSVPSRPDIRARSLSVGPTENPVRFGYYLPGANGTLTVLGQALDSAGCVRGEGTVDVPGAAAGATIGPVQLAISALPVVRCAGDDGGAQGDASIDSSSGSDAGGGGGFGGSGTGGAGAGSGGSDGGTDAAGSDGVVGAGTGGLIGGSGGIGPAGTGGVTAGTGGSGTAGSGTGGSGIGGRGSGGVGTGGTGTGGSGTGGSSGKDAGANCTATTECQPGLTCLDGVCCTSSICPTCRNCAASDTNGAHGVCSMIVGSAAGTNDDTGTACNGARTCNASGACVLTDGQSCGSSDSSCLTGHCLDGVCCQTSTCGPCLNCGPSGTCTTTVRNAEDSTGMTCSVTQSCDAAGTCQQKSCDIIGCAPRMACVNSACVPARRLFITKVAVGANFGGAQGADTKCQQIVDSAGLGGTWMAWVSDPSTSPATRFTRATVPYRLLDGTLVATDWTALTSGTLAHGINKDEAKGDHPNSEVWTATTTGGTLMGDGCVEFTSNDSGAPAAEVGNSDGTDSTWTAVYTQTCERVNVRLYCVEQ